MKKNLFYLFALICSVSLFTACSDDDENGIALEKVNGTYEGATLNLTYSGAPYAGKSVIFNTTDAQNATLTMSGAALALPMLDIANPGVIPGETTTTLKVTLKAANAGFTFTGVDKVNGRTINYSGSVEEGKLNLNLNVEMPKNDLAGTWDLQVYNHVESTTPFTYVWKSEKKIMMQLPFPDGNPITAPVEPEKLLGTILSNLLIVQVGTEKETIEDAMQYLLKNVTFQADGNVVAEYSEKQNIADPKWKTSPLNVAQYAIKDSKLYLYLNADAIMQMVLAPKQKAFNPSSLLVTLLPKLLEFAPMISQGIPMDYTLVDGKLVVTLDEAVCKQLLNKIIIPLVQNKEFMDFVKAQLVNWGGDMANMALPMLDQLKDVLPTTTEMNFGLNFSKSAAQ